VAEYFRGLGAVSTLDNATTGLMLAIAFVKVPGRRYAVMPRLTFSATPLAPIWAGLEPYFVDVRMSDFAVDQFARCGLADGGWMSQEFGGEFPHQFFPLLCPPRGTANLEVAR
jgi:hypothetical protein